MLEHDATEKVLGLLRSYAASRSGVPPRGDLVIPESVIPRLVDDMLATVREASEPEQEATDLDLFRVLSETRRLASLQDQVARLQRSFRILRRPEDVAVIE